MDFLKDYVLEDEVVKLMPLQKSDWENLLPFSLQEPDLWQYSLLQVDSPEKLKTYIQHATDARLSETSYPFVVFDLRTGKYAGSTRFYDIQLAEKNIKLGYTWYGKEFQGTGLNKNCKFLLLEFAFEVLKMERVEFRADNDNKRSISAMKSIGCVEEGVLRSDSYKVNGDRRNSIVLSILKEEWFSKVKGNLQKLIV